MYLVNQNSRRGFADIRVFYFLFYFILFLLQALSIWSVLWDLGCYKMYCCGETKLTLCELIHICA
jgi:hypothetical protein